MIKSKIAFVMAILSLILSIVVVVYKFNYVTNKPVADITRNINVLLDKSNNWKKIVHNSGFTKSTYPNIDGSTATIPISMEFAREHFDMSEKEIKNFVKHNTTHSAYVNLINKKADLILVSEPSKAEMELAKQNGVEFQLTPIAKDAFVFIVNKKNPVNSLSIEQIQQIYQGTIINWSEVGGSNKKIVAYQREENSGSQTIMTNMVMSGKKMMKPPTFKEDDGMGAMIDQVAEFKDAENSIGYTIYYYVTRLYKSENIKLLGINGVDCNRNTIKNGSYPFSGNVYAVTLKNQSKDSNANRLLEWILSDEGQKCVEQAGFTSIK